MTQRFMRDIANALKTNAEKSIMAILSTEQKCLRELAHISTDQSLDNRVRYAALNAQTNIITITQSLSSIDGFADAATLDCIAMCLDHGVRVCEGGRRFMYCAKASKSERAGSKHPTVKPINLMRYLCKLVTPKGGTVLDPFAGTGTTGQAAVEEGFNVILIEREAAYCQDIRRRLALYLPDHTGREPLIQLVG